MSAVSVESVSRVMAELLVREGREVRYRDPVSNADLVVSPATAASPRGLLPALVVAGEAVWREATGKGFALDVVRDRDAMLGFRLRGIGAGTLTTVMLSTMEAASQVARPGMFVIADLHALWSATTHRIERSTRPTATASASVSGSAAPAAGAAP